MGDWRNYLGFEGRLNRRPYWLMGLVIAVAAILGFIVVALLAAMLPVFWILGAPLGIGLIWTGSSIAARRLHDRNKSAWWLLLYQAAPTVLDGMRTFFPSPPGGFGLGDLCGLIGFGITMWVLVDLGFMPGTSGPNRYGDDPLHPALDVFA